MYSQAFDHFPEKHDRSAEFNDEDAVYTDPDTLQAEVQQDYLAKRRSRGLGTGFRKKDCNAGYIELNCDDMGQSSSTDYIDVFDNGPRRTSPQRSERSRSDGHVIQQGKPITERGMSQPSVALGGHTNEESSDYCFAVEPGTERPELRKKLPLPQRSVSVENDYSQPQDRLSHVRSQDYTEPYQTQEGKKNPARNQSGQSDPGIYQLATEPVKKEGAGTKGENAYNTTYNQITSGLDKAKLAEIAGSYDHIDTLKNQARGAGGSENHQPRVTSPGHKHSNTSCNFPLASSSSTPGKMQKCGGGEIPANYEEPWDSTAGQRKLSNLFTKAEKTDVRRTSLDKQSGQSDQAIAKNVRRTAADRNPSVDIKEAISETGNPGPCADQQGEVYETSWGQPVKRNSFDRNRNQIIDALVKQKAGNLPPPPVKHEVIPANYEEAWDTPEKQREFEEKLAKARKKRASEGQIKADNSEEQQGEKIKNSESKFSHEVVKPPMLPAPRRPHVSTHQANWSRAESCRSLGALAEKIDSSIPLQDQIFYHGAIKRGDAEKMLLVFKEGSYLIRRSETNKRDYSLTLKGWNGIAMHMKIVTNDDGTYILGENSPPFPTIPEMVHYYTSHELPVQNAERICLLYPIPC